MKRSALSLIIIALIAFTIVINAKDEGKVPSVKIKNLKNEVVDTKKFSNNGKPFIINFWATWCKPCVEELKAIHEVYPDWVKQTGVKIYAISIDDTRNSKKVAPFVNGRGWKYEVMLDENSDFKRAMNVNNPPHTFLCNGKGDIVWQHNGYAPGDEKKLFAELKKLAK